MDQLAAITQKSEREAKKMKEKLRLVTRSKQWNDDDDDVLDAFGPNSKIITTTETAKRERKKKKHK